MKKFLYFLGFYGGLLAIVSMIFIFIEMSKIPDEEITVWNIISLIVELALFLPVVMACTIEHLCNFVHLIMKEKREEEQEKENAHD